MASCFLNPKEEQCEPEFYGLAWPPLDLEAVSLVQNMSFDHLSFFNDIVIDETGTAVLVLEKTKKPVDAVDEKGTAILKKTAKPAEDEQKKIKPLFGKWKDSETVLSQINNSPPSACQPNPKGPTKSHDYHPQDWNDEEKMEGSKRKLRQRYEEEENRKKKRKVQLLQIADLPEPRKPQRGRVSDKNKLLRKQGISNKNKLSRSSMCPVF